MNKKQIDKKRAEGFVFVSLFIIPVLIFIITPAHPEGNIGYRIDGFFNQYLFGNGWYIPSNYPFAAKVTNSLSVIWAVVAGLLMGIWRRNDIITPQPTNFWWPLELWSILMDRKQVESYVLSLTFILPVLIFIVTPAHPSGSISYRLDGFINQYLFGNGWYIPSNYPFAAKVTNNLTAIWAVVSGLFIGVWRRNDIIGPFPKIPDGIF